MMKEQKQKNPKIGRPAKTNQQQQFKTHYLINKRKFQLECQLLVCIHQSYFDQIPCNPINRRISINCLTHLFQIHDSLPVYQTLLKMNEKYFKNSSLFPDEKLRYTSIIDIAYLTKQVKEKHGPKLKCIDLLLIIFFYLYNEKLVNDQFYKYFKEKVNFYKEAIIRGPQAGNLNKLDVLIIALAIQLAVRQEVMIIR